MLRRSAFALLALAFLACGLDVTGVAPLGGEMPDASAPETGSTPNPALDGGTDASESTNEGGTEADASDAAPDGEVTLTVVTQGDPTAIVSSGDGRIACPKTGACSATYAPGTSVVLTATPPSIDSTLASWSVKSCGREPTCTVKLDAALTVTARFAPHVNYAHTATQLFTVRSSDGLTGTKTTITGCDGNNVNDLAIARDGRAFVVTSHGISTLYGFDLATAKCTKRGDLGVLVNGLTFAPNPGDPSVDLLLASGGGTLYTVNETSGAATVFKDLGSNTSSGDVVWLPGRGLFISFTNGGSGGTNDRLAQIDLPTGKVTVLGTLPSPEVWALAWRGSELIGLADGVVFTVDPVTSISTVLNASTGVHPYGAASAP